LADLLRADVTPVTLHEHRSCHRRDPERCDELLDSVLIARVPSDSAVDEATALVWLNAAGPHGMSDGGQKAA
jgi:hypothetical protein